jgi:superfamily II RNA helicase
MPENMVLPTLGDLLRNLQAQVGPAPLDSGLLLDAFVEWSAARGLSLYPAQEEAMLELLEGKNVILNTPTGSGKSLVASMLHLQALAQGRRSAYTCPIKALVNEKWMALCREFGPENVGLATGDATVNRDAPILCCTAEILSNMALRDGAACPIRDVVVDEFHYYSDRDRGVAWQVPLLTLKNARFLLMSATLGETAFFENSLTQLNGQPTVTVRGSDRPVPLEFTYSESPLASTLQGLVTQEQAPVYVVHFTQNDAARNAQAFTSLELCNKEQKAAVAKALEGFRFSSPYGPDLKRWLRQGIGIHHAGLLPKYRILVEKLAQQGLLKVICGTDTLGVGVNVPIRTVLFTQLCKYSGDKTAILTARDFHQISGRAGRKGFDNVGYVVAQAPEHVIENLQLSAKSSKSGKKFVKRQPPEKGYVHWDKETFLRLIDAAPEKLTSRFAVSHGMLLNILARPTDGCRALRNLIDESHSTSKEKAAHRKRAFQLFRSLVERQIIEFIPKKDRALLVASALVADRTQETSIEQSAKLRVNDDLHANFSLDQALSLYLLDTIPLLDRESPEYHLDLLTLVESILEDPDQVLRRQLDRLKTQRMAEMKAEGVEYDARIAELDAMEHPKPLREFVYQSFNLFASQHPWVGQENIHPKSIAREIIEEFLTFSGYVKTYSLERSEGLLLRHLNGVYKVLSHTVPAEAKTEAVQEVESYLGEMIRRVDSSLLEEWERMRNPEFVAVDQEELAAIGAEDIVANTTAFTAAIRARLFAFLACLRRGDFAEALLELAEELPEGTFPTDELGERWSELRLQTLLEQYRTEHGLFRLDSEGRALRHTLVERDVPLPDTVGAGPFWKVTQMLQDQEECNDWAATFRVDLEASRGAGAPVLQLARLGEV